VSETFQIETVIAGVGYIRPSEKLAIRQHLGNGAVINHDPVQSELNLGWRIDADSMDPAIDLARRMQDRASEATGVYVPRTTLFLVRHMPEE
jgi:hypothetical protein